MPNRIFTDLSDLRTVVNSLIDQGKVRVHRHAKDKHPELSDIERIAIVRYGGRMRPDRKRAASEGVYVCWATRPLLGLCRAVLCVEEEEGGDSVLIITAFPEQ
jgi:hypothetical protein